MDIEEVKNRLLTYKCNDSDLEEVWEFIKDKQSKIEELEDNKLIMVNLLNNNNRDITRINNLAKSMNVSPLDLAKKETNSFLESLEWISIKDQPLPTDPLIKIIRWNKIHKCSISVFYYPDHDESMPWCTGDLSHCWPEESFLPYWKPECEAPIE